MTAPQLLFREDQQFRQPWLWVFLLMGSALAMGTVLFFLMQLLTESQVDGTPGMPFSTVVMLGLALFLGNAAIVGMIGIARLQTEVTTSGLYLRFVPYHAKVRMIVLDGVQSIETVEVRPWADYAGYGIRRRRMSTAYIVNGGNGVKIQYTNGCHIFLGSQHPDELKTALHAALHSGSN